MHRFLLLLLPALVVAQPQPTTHTSPLPALRQQAEERQAWTEKRLETVLPALMEEFDIDMWILSMREYGEDPVFWSMTAPTTFAARRRSIYVFDKQDDGTVRRLALGGGSQGGLYEAYVDPDQSVEGRELWGEGQWYLLNKLVTDADPERIALNIDELQAFADGLGAGEREGLERALGETYTARVVREPRLATNYISIRIPEMLPRYRELTELVHGLLSEAFSSRVITPGVTTTDDVRWWLRQQLNDLGLSTWFHPSIAVQREGGTGMLSGVVIERGDLLWSDFGLVGMNMHTDTQHLGYVLKEGETDVPEGLKAGLRTSNRLQDLLLEEMEPGRTGNEVLMSTLERMRTEGINGTVYTHPIGDHGHGAGPLIGLWDRQRPIAGRGDLLLRPNTWFSIELQATSQVPEWGGQAVQFRQEEEAYLDASGNRHWVLGRQETFWVVRDD
ncbi:MAG: M24 family metallopeptidase [Bacteroidota bacterium]